MFKLTAKIEDKGEYLCVRPVAIDSPLPLRFGISVGRNRQLGERLIRAIEAGVAITATRVAKDVNGNEYIESHCHVLGRRLNADLRRLGF